MKKNSIFTVLAAVATFTACSNDNEPCTGDKVDFFISNSPITRTEVNTLDAATKFIENDQVGIYATGGVTADNVGYSVGSGTDGALSPISGMPLYWNDATAQGNFYAYYPYVTPQEAGNKVVYTITDQDTKEKFNKNDFLVAYKTGVVNNTEVTFKFAHALSLVQVVLTGAEAADVTSVIIAAKPTAEWDFLSNTLTAGGTDKKIKMWKIVNDRQEYWAMVPSQVIAAEAALFTISNGAATFTYKPSVATTLSVARSKKFNLQLGSGTAVSVATEVNTDTWTTDSPETGIAIKDIVSPIELISAAAGTFSASTVINLKTNKQSCVEGWNSIITEAYGTISVNSEENAVSLHKTGGSWYNSTLYYCTAENMATKAKYKLTFELKATFASDIQLALMPCIADNQYFVQDNSALSPVSYSTAATEWTAKELTFDLSKIKTNVAVGTEATLSTPDNLKKVLLYFTPKLSGENTFYIKNVKLTEMK